MSNFTRNSATRADASRMQLTEQFAAIATRLEVTARSVQATRTTLELRPAPPIDLEELVARLTSHGADALTMREERALVSQPNRVSHAHVELLIRASPGLARHLLRACLADWRAYRTAAWGSAYDWLLVRSARASGIRLFEGEVGSPKALLQRASPNGATVVAEALVGAPLHKAHEYLTEKLGVRDSWLYAAEVLCGWLRRRLEHGLPLDEALSHILRTPSLRTMLLPSKAGDAASAGVRTDEEVHGDAVAAFFDAAYRAPPLLSGSSLAELSTLVMRSTFNDPRLPPLSTGWTHVRRLAGASFRRFMTSLAEQDLEVFFEYAMNERDRRTFWLSYLPMIERTGCVLDAGLRESLYKKLSGDEKLRAAVQRTRSFRRGSATQAFYLVFPQHVIIEFSTTGNAAYVYRREMFESAIERRIQSRAIESVADLKLKGREEHRITHGGSWQSTTAQWLSSQGIHSKRRW